MTDPTIGILAGSGPEAGLDLWSKLLHARRVELGDRYRGDVDAPRVVVLSEPELGLSIELATHTDRVWQALEAAARSLTALVEVWAIACNTLNHFAPQLDALGLDATLITPDGAAARHLARNGIDTVGLLGAKPVAELASLSPYRSLIGEFEVVAPTAADREDLHTLIEEVKLDGAARADHPARLAQIIDRLPAETDHVLLACTELPLVQVETTRQLIDVTGLVAAELLSFR